MFTNEAKAIELWESKRWPDGAICPHCGLVGEAYKLQGKTTRPGLWKCKGCRKPFTAKMRSLFEDSHIPMQKWMYAVHPLYAQARKVSAHTTFHRMTETFYGEKVAYRTAWFMFHRIRFAMTQHPMVRSSREPSNATKPMRVARFALGATNHATARSRSIALRVTIKRPCSQSYSVGVTLVRVTFSASRAGTDLMPIVKEMIAEDAHVMTDSSTVLSGTQAGRCFT